MVCCTPRCDIVLPVYNGLAHVRDCVESVLAYTSPDRYRLFVVDDASDTATCGYLEKLKQTRTPISVHRHERNQGFVRACNAGIRLGAAPYVVVINSDVVVTPEWLDRLVACAESDPRIAFVNPLTNAAPHIEVPIAPGANFFGMDRHVRDHAPRAYPDVVTGVGFCMLLRRSALEQVGWFDEAYGKGYCEESDLCMRLTASGYRTVVADDVYVYHKGGGSFKDRDAQYARNRAIFDTRWKTEYTRRFRAFQRADPLRPVRDLFLLPQRWDPRPAMWQTARGMLAHWRERRWFRAARTMAGGGFRMLRARRSVASAASVARVTRPGRLRVTYVLYELVVAGGVLSVIQLVNELILSGVEARIVALYEDPAIEERIPLYTRPVIFRNARELIAQFPESDIAVATLWNTAAWVRDAVHSGKAATAVYYIQDYEAWFFPEDRQSERRRVLQTYDMIHRKIVTSDWLRGMLAKHGYEAHKIVYGMDLERFYPRDARPERPTVLAMARPATPRRGFRVIVEAFGKVAAEVPDVDIVLFGDRFLRFRAMPFAFRDEGVVTDQDRLAELYSEADVFLDGSAFQGFGRCGLEAMACGAACVLTGTGGVMEYAKHGENALVAPPGQPDALAGAVVTLLRDPELRRRLGDNGLKTAQNYCRKREAAETLAYFQRVSG